MKLPLSLALLVLAAQPASADIRLVAPGVPAGTITAAQVPFMETYVLPDSYKFVFSGIQAKGDTLGAPGSSGTSGNGGQFHVSATVTGPDGSVKEGNITFRDVQDFNTSPWQIINLVPSKVFAATTTPITIGLQWQGQGNAHKPNGVFTILGEYQKSPPPPVGFLNFAVGDYMLVEAGTQPPGVATITRE